MGTFNKIKPRVAFGTIGHIDHGKTTLIAAIATVMMANFKGAAPAERIEVEEPVEFKPVPTPSNNKRQARKMRKLANRT